MDMKAWLWGGLALTGLLWTGAAGLFALGVEWMVQALMSAGNSTVKFDATGLAIPAWLSPWVDNAAWEAMREWLFVALSGLESIWPLLEGMAGWLVPAVWVVWGLGLMLLIGLAILVGTLNLRIR
jgi:hypothetical protein